MVNLSATLRIRSPKSGRSIERSSLPLGYSKLLVPVGAGRMSWSRAAMCSSALAGDLRLRFRCDGLLERKHETNGAGTEPIGI